MEPREILKKLDTCFKSAMQHGLGKRGLVFPLDPESIEDAELRHTCQRMSTIFDMITEAYHYAEQLAQGDLEAETSRKNIFAMPLKGLQASLSHLTWQANQVAEGDLSQQVYFLGEFSKAFNRMIDFLREKKDLEEKLKIITDLLDEGLLLVDCDGKIIFANPGALQVLGWTFEEIQNRPLHEMLPNPSREDPLVEPEEDPLWKAICKGENHTEDNGVFTGSSGSLIPVSISSRPVHRNGALHGAVIAFRDITEQKKYLKSLETINRLLEKQATTDALTGIYNRMKFDTLLTREIQRARRNRVPFSLIIMDIDHFKTVNDTYGHLAGDAVLIQLARLVTANVREIDFFARWGGEEFVILTPGTRLKGALQLAEKLRAKVEHFDFKKPERITMSFGVTAFEEGDTAASLVKRADAALYRAKQMGRNQVNAQ